MAEFYMLDMGGKPVKITDEATPATATDPDAFEARIQGWAQVNNYYRPKNAKPNKQKTPPAEPTFNEWGEVGL